MNNTMIKVLCGAVLLVLGSHDLGAAVPISPGETVNVNVDGRASIYGVEGHQGSVDGKTVLPAVELTFSAGPLNIFNFMATGTTNCCNSPTPYTPPDGNTYNTNISALNGLSASIGNSQLGLLGVFTDGSDPYGMTPPAALYWDRNNPTSLAPQLRQVFYIGDGRNGYNNSGGDLLNFTAPSTATKLFLGFADGWWFQGNPSYYFDNTGSLDVDVLLQSQPVPEPSTLLLLGSGLAGAFVRKWRRLLGCR